MPGASCRIFGALHLEGNLEKVSLSCRAEKTQDEWANQITRNHVIDADLQRQINEAIPTLNLPPKSFETERKPKRPLKRHKTDEGSSGASTTKESSRVYNINMYMTLNAELQY